MVFINFLNLSSNYLREKSRIDQLQIKQGGIFYGRQNIDLQGLQRGIHFQWERTGFLQRKRFRKRTAKMSRLQESKKTAEKPWFLQRPVNLKRAQALFLLFWFCWEKYTFSMNIKYRTIWNNKESFHFTCFLNKPYHKRWLENKNSSGCFQVWFSTKWRRENKTWLTHR